MDLSTVYVCLPFRLPIYETPAAYLLETGTQVCARPLAVISPLPGELSPESSRPVVG